MHYFRFAVLILLLLMPAPFIIAQDTPPDSTEPEATTTYIVQRGDLLNRIALLHNTTVTELIRLNPGIGNPNVIYAGQTLIVPAPGNQPAQEAPQIVEPEPAIADPSAEAEAAPESVPEIAEPPPAEIASVDIPTITFAHGVAANLLVGDSNRALGQIEQIGASWVKQEIHWRDLETAPGEINFAALDPVIDMLESRGFNILLTVTHAPDWARSIQEENGPPDNFANFGAFMSALAERYAGRVQAYEIWTEPNLRSRWKSTLHPIGAASYIDLLRHGHDAIKAMDAEAIIVTAGLAPTGFNDAFNAQAGDLEVNAVDDRVFLSNLYQQGVTNYADAIGAHPMGWANPPDVRCCTASSGVLTHYENEHFYFLDTLERYRQIMTENGDAERALWVTKFGWGTHEGVAAQPTDDVNIFISYINQQQQAVYISRAFEIGRDLGYIGPMFVYNLNACPAMTPYDAGGCFYSLTDPSGNPRLAFIALMTALPAEEAIPAAEPVEEELIPEVEVTPEVTPAG